MGLDITSRPSDSPYVEQVWHSRSSGVDRMTAVASATWDLVVLEQRGRVHVSVQGPESKAAPAPVPEEARFFGITFALGTTMPHLPVAALVDRGAELPTAGCRSFWLHGSAWRFPEEDDAELFVRRLVGAGLLVRDPVVAAVLEGRTPNESPRTVQRRFLATTGLNQGTVRQIGRARRAALLVGAGVAAQEVVHRLGYFDQPHLARSLRRYIGRTAGQLRTGQPAEPLSLLYKT
jgi:hypothetical protein